MDINDTELLNSIQAIVDKGGSLKYAISVVCKEKNLNPHQVYNEYFKKDNIQQDVKINSYTNGDYVKLKNNSENEYEIININDKDNILLRDMNTNNQLTVSEKEITPVITENKMKKINEAQYNISIEGLETEDAATLSQMLSLASQAESTAPMMDPMNVGIEEPVEDDVPFDEELPVDTVMPTIEEPTIEEPSMEDEIEPSVEEMMDDGMFETEDLEEDLLLSKEESDPTFVAQQELEDSDLMLDDDIMETLRNAGVELNEELDADTTLQDDYAEDLVEENEEMIMENGELSSYVKTIVDELLQSGQFNPSDVDELRQQIETFDSKEYVDEVVEWFKNNYNKNGFIGEINESEDDLNKWLDKDFIEKELSKEDEEKLEEGYDDSIIDDYGDDVDSFMSDYFYDNAELQSEIDYDFAEENKARIFDVWKENVLNGEEEYVAAENAYNEVKGSNSQDIDFDDEIAESLRIAGVQLDEVNDEFHRKGQIVKDETLFRNKEEDEQKYEEVSTSDFGKESSEGFKKPLCVEATVKMDKIQSIYETAKSMYAKKESKDWLKLDRRYITKLMENGIGYSRASKMLMEAKKNK